MRNRLKNARRVVVKLGTNVLGAAGGGFDEPAIAAIVADLAAARAAGREIVIVSSGAVLAGRSVMEKGGRAADRLDVTVKQALAAVGQTELMRFWANLFAGHQVRVGQVLVTRDLIHVHRRFFNARHTLSALIAWGVVPIVNENDTVASEEIRLGDNDQLSAVVAGLVDADALILLTDQEGLYTRDPTAHPDAELVPVVSLTGDEDFVPGLPRSGRGLGGMQSKVTAARFAARFGVTTVIARGKRDGVLRDVLAGEEVGTIFETRDTLIRGKKRWLFFHDAPLGRLLVDAGASRALIEKGRSLLPSGIREVDGEFSQGAPVEVRDEEGRSLARGLSAYSSREIRLIMGRRSGEIEEILGFTLGDEVIHRDDLLVLD
ncbi:glutamate 5-kinase [bacterium]|nr:glutamate 5-kinase [bacterium]